MREALISSPKLPLYTLSEPGCVQVGVCLSLLRPGLRGNGIWWAAGTRQIRVPDRLSHSQLDKKLLSKLPISLRNCDPTCCIRNSTVDVVVSLDRDNLTSSTALYDQEQGPIHPLLQ